ncbi:MAG TPA: nucleotidyltransferase family protein [Hyphomicrobiales bacterium]|nr:nucleotidyltransferase family protein [Hyphomicrobiales bacterium]
MTGSGLRVGCLVLAAGRASRFGADKRLARLPNGNTLLAQSLENAATVFSQRILVLREDDGEPIQRYRDNWLIVTAAQAARGMGHSLAAALPALQAWDAAVVILADMPWIKPQTLRRIADAAAADTLVVPYCGGQRGNPVCIGRDFFTELASPQGDQGARLLLQRHPTRLLRLDLDDPGILRDVDTPQALDGTSPESGDAANTPT